MKPTPARNTAIRDIGHAIEIAEREKINSQKVPGAFTNGYIDRLDALYATLRQANGYSADPPLPDIIMDLTGGLFSRSYAETTRVVSSTVTGTMLRVSTTPATVSANQNTPVTVPVQISTSFADTYDLSAEAPTGWTVAFDTAGNLTITPAPGLQGGAFDVRIVAKSKVNPALVAQTNLTVNFTATAPGLTLTVPHDPLFTVPYQGAQVPTSFRTTIRNLGPAADTYTISTANIPSGFTLQTTANSVTVPAGQTGVLGLYLVPNGGPLPAPGTVLTFNVTAASTTNPLLTQTQQVTFTMPEVHGLTFVSSPSSVSTTPGAATSTTLTVKAVGNVSETVTLTATTIAGLTTTGLPQPFNLAVGASQSFTIGLTPATTVPLNSTLSPSFSTAFGTTATPFAQSLVVPIRVVVPGADAMARGAVTASQLGYTDLGNRLNDLATATTNLFQNQTDPVPRSQSIAAINAIITQVQANQYQSFLVNQLTANRDVLSAATTPTAIGNAISNLGATLTTLSATLQDEFDHRFEFSLSPNTAVAFPGSPTAYLIGISNIGSQPTTYNFSVSGLPSGVSGSFTQNSVTLQPGESIVGGPNAIYFNVTQTGLSLVPARFTITVTASTAPAITQTENAILTVRQQLVKVTSVTPSESFTNPGTSVNVSAAILNAVNTPQTAKVLFTVKNPGGTVVFTSTPVDVTLGITSSLTTVSLGSFSTTGFTLGEYTIDVTVTDASSVPFANSAGQGKLLVGTPLSGTITTTNATLIPQTGTVTTTVSLAAQTALTAPFTLVGQTATTVLSTTITIVGSTAYVAGTNGVDIVDVSNPAAPVRLSTFASGLIVQNGFTVIRQLSGNRLFVGSRELLNSIGFRCLIYSIADPLNPTLITNTLIDRAFLSDFLLSGSIALVPTYGVWFSGSSSSGAAGDQFGDVVALNMDSVGGPTVTDMLQGTRSAPYNGEFTRFGGVIANSSTAYIASTTATGNQFTTATGKLEVVDFSNPANLTVVREVLIPNTHTLFNIAIEGNLAIAVGSTRGIQQFWNNSNGTPSDDSGYIGNLTITTLDISDPLNPVVLTTLITTATLPRNALADVSKLAITPVGDGRFAVSLGIVDGSPVIFLLDASTPTTPITSAFQVPSLVSEMSFLNGRLYTTSSTGLLIYDVGNVDAIPATVSVQVPKNTGVSIVPNSYNIAPNQIISGANFDTLVWNRQLAFGLNNDTLTWQSQVTNLVSGEVRPVTLGTTISYNYAASNATANFPATSVAASRVISMTPPSRSVTPGNTASYTITLTNPSNTGINFTLAAAGLPAEWVNLPNAFFVSANSTETLTLELTPPALANLKDYGFTVTASTSNGVAGVVEGLLTVNGPAPAVDVQSHGVVVTITPVQSTAGDGSPAYYTVRFTNTGSMTETFDFTESDSAGLIDAFSTFEITVPPGASNFREIRLSLLPQSITPRGVVPFSVTATSQTSSATGTANSTVNVVSSGVSVFFNRTVGKPGETFQAEVTNRGSTTDTFQLSPGDVGGVIASLSTSSVTLAPGEKAMVDVTTTSAPFAAQGFIPLSIVARSTVNANVAAQDSTSLVIDPSIGLTANFSPATRDITWPGQTDFALLVNNTGNTEDQYTATITGVTGLITASLIGLDGQPTQTISSFRLPGLSTGSLVLRVNLNGSDRGTVTVQIRSLRNDLSTTSTATVNVLNPVVPPVVPPVVAPVPPVVTPIPPVVSPPIPSRVQRYFAIGAGQGMEPIVKVYDGITKELKFQFLAYESTFTGGVTVAIGDVNGDGVPDILTGTGEGGGGRVRVFNGIDQSQLANFFAYSSEFRGGVNVALGDLDGDGISEVITGAGVGGGGHVRSFKIRNGEAEQLAGPLGNFMAYASDFRGGVHVASADIDGDGKMEIITGAGSGGASHVRVWRADGADILNFFAYSLSFSGGVNVAAGDLDGDGKAEIVTGPGGEPGSGPHVEVFQNGAITQSYFAYAPYQDPANTWSGGVRVNVSLASDGKPGIVTAAAAGVGGGPHIRRWNASTLSEVDNFFAFDPSFEGGVYVG